MSDTYAYSQINFNILLIRKYFNTVIMKKNDVALLKETYIYDLNYIITFRTLLVHIYIFFKFYNL